jgi:predicted nucleic acid-binding protein
MTTAPVLLDTSIYVTALRAGDGALLQLRRFTSAPLWLSSVVLEELYAGVKPRDSRVLERLEHDFERAGRILVPNLRDWTMTGRVLARFAAKHDYEQIGQARLTNDALLAMSAARRGMTIITANERDFARLAPFRPFRWQVAASALFNFS